jgi:hypothetical protein
MGTTDMNNRDERIPTLVAQIFLPSGFHSTGLINIGPLFKAVRGAARYYHFKG